MDFVDRTFENSEEESIISVQLDCGFNIDFWEKGLSDDEYIRRAKMIKKLGI